MKTDQGADRQPFGFAHAEHCSDPIAWLLVSGKGKPMAIPINYIEDRDRIQPDDWLLPVISAFLSTGACPGRVVD
jgi:hypothetical protein